MHTPVSALKTAARDQASTTVVELVRRLFNLEDEEKRSAASSSLAAETGASH
jgi:hypothetical protein